jgi:hypothetical protein
VQKFLEGRTMLVNYRKEFRSISPHIQGNIFEELYAKFSTLLGITFMEHLFLTEDGCSLAGIHHFYSLFCPVSTLLHEIFE